MDANFAFDVDPRRDLVRITMSGFFQPADIVRYERARELAFARLRCAPNRHLTLCDVSAMKIQTQDVVNEFARLVADPRFVSRRMAFVTGSSLARLQTRRVAERDTIAYFSDLAAAEAWLFGESASQAA
jgi:sulfite reductase beta subunit-like hemoprotein